jgi:hypothetical protein
VTSIGKHSDYPESFFSDAILNSCSSSMLEILNMYKCGPSSRYFSSIRGLFSHKMLHKSPGCNYSLIISTTESLNTAFRPQSNHYFSHFTEDSSIMLLNWFNIYCHETPASYDNKADFPTPLEFPYLKLLGVISMKASGAEYKPRQSSYII